MQTCAQLAYQEWQVIAAHPNSLAAICGWCAFKEAPGRVDLDLIMTQMRVTTMRLKDAPMTRNQLVRQLAEISTRPVGVSSASNTAAIEPASMQGSVEAPTELFVWFEDTAARALEGRRGVAGLPESLLPISREMRVIERRYAENHLHLLSAVRIACRQNAAELIASLYTAALSVGTVAWIGTGKQYAHTWSDMYPATATK